ncbi:alanyl-tRNA editing protein [Fusobacterium sp.]|uniref:alanyl-tRNA editing protein n=1 Tax=Fusobacterium sp. TaxID=68766 RepID=UPI00396C3488
MKINVLTCKQNKNRYEITVSPEDIFYPDGKGGQLGDRGSIGQSDVVEVTEDKIFVNRELEIGEHEYTIDQKRRKDIAQQHTAQHTFSAIAFNNYNLNTVGFRMSEEYTTVDLDSNTLTDETIENIEKLVNDVINQGIDIKIYTLSHDEAFKLDDLRKPVKDKITGDVRFVEIPHIDLGACAGFHVNNTREIRVFKIVNHEKVKGDYTRFYFLAGDRALEDYSYKHMMTRELCHTFSCKEDGILDMVDKTIESKIQAENEIKTLAFEYAELLSKKLLEQSLKIKDHSLVVYSGNKAVGDNLHKHLNSDNIILITSNGESHALTSQSLDCKALIGFITAHNSSVKGGGSKVRGNFKGNLSEEEIKKYVTDYVNSL